MSTRATSGESVERRRVSVISLGGTIASTKVSDAASGVAPQLGAHELVASVSAWGEVAELEAVAFRQVPSGDLTWDDLTDLAAEIERRIDAGAYGVVVTQGTDTLDETSFALDLLVRRAAPVVVTGAMRNPTMAGADGPANLLAAVQVAASAHARGLGTVVVMNDEIHAARFVRKTHSSSLGAFRSPTVGPLGWVSEGRVRVVYHLAPLPDVTSGAIRAMPPVALLTSVLGEDARLLGQIEPLGYAGLVVETFGAGHVSSVVMATLADVAARLPVVFASRTGAGEVLSDTYAFAGSERDLLARGLISAGFLDGRKARVLLSVLLRVDGSLERVRSAFAQVNATASLHD